MVAISFLLRLGLAILVAFWPSVCSCSSACRMQHAGSPVSSTRDTPGVRDCCGSRESDREGDDGGMALCTCAQASRMPLELGSAPVVPPAVLASFLPYGVQSSVLRAEACAHAVILSRAQRAPPLPPLPFLLVLRQ